MLQIALSTLLIEVRLFDKVDRDGLFSLTVYNTKGTRAHTHRELIRKWLWEPKGSSLEYI